MTDFEAMYRRDADPWSVRSAWYERRKRALLMAALPRERYRLALELGSGTGETTRVLAARCDAVRAVDLSATAVESSRQRLSSDGLDHVDVAVMRLPEAWPLGEHAQADLIVVSELAYYFDDAALARFFAKCHASLALGADWVMCHYTRDFHDRCQPTHRLHDAVDTMPDLCRIVTHVDEDFRLDVWRRLPGARP